MSGGRGQGSGDGARLIFSLRRGRREIVKKRTVSGPIGVRAEELFLRRAPGVIGPPRRPRRALTRGPGLVARLKPRPRVEPRADGPKTAGDSGRVSPPQRRCRWGPKTSEVQFRPVGRRSSAAPEHGRGPWQCWGRPAIRTETEQYDAGVAARPMSKLGGRLIGGGALGPGSYQRGDGSGR
ncbi:hypothetical protein NDU88_002808 [Pleurodeles waltl]|uniref:Uncharacterized protein n=1 Tax=Pleurodeles waltl TaxID=8319 RepID=A0AAV7UE41_PLEWA|nr:hypothetical protein NDU88_002808 [Pleurodeles waltl]